MKAEEYKNKKHNGKGSFTSNGTEDSAFNASGRLLIIISQRNSREEYLDGHYQLTQLTSPR